jgi:putative transcriptional regulator
MSAFGKRLIESAEQAVAFTKGEADLKDYRVHIPDEIDVKARKKKRRSPLVKK